MFALLGRMLAPLNHSGPQKRREEIRENANREYSTQLLKQERAYWRAFLAKAATEADRATAEWELRHLDTLEELAIRRAEGRFHD
jgi:hypothetical protein